MIWKTLLKQDLVNGFRKPIHIVSLVTFVLVASLLFPIAIGPEPQVLERLAVGLIWVLILFSTQLMAPTIWRQDIEDGTIEQLCLTGVPREWIVLSKVSSVWILCFGSLFLMMPVIGIAFGMHGHSIAGFMEIFLIVSLPLSFLSVTGGLITHGQPLSAALSTIILLPLYLPLLIFSCSACDSSAPTEAISLFITMLAGISLITCIGMLYTNVFLLRL